MSKLTRELIKKEWADLAQVIGTSTFSWKTSLGWTATAFSALACLVEVFQWRILDLDRHGEWAADAVFVVLWMIASVPFDPFDVGVDDC